MVHLAAAVAERLERPDAGARAARLTALSLTRAPPSGGFFASSSLVRPLYRSCQPQPTASKPLMEKEVASRTLSRPAEKTGNRDVVTGAKTPSLGWSRSRGNDAFQGGTGKKNPNRIRVGILSIGGGRLTMCRPASRPDEHWRGLLRVNAKLPKATGEFVVIPEIHRPRSCIPSPGSRAGACPTSVAAPDDRCPRNR